MDIKNISNANLAHLHAAAHLGMEAALGVGEDADYEAACRVAAAYRREVQRRVMALTEAQDQDGLDALNGALRGMSVAEIQAERATL